MASLNENLVVGGPIWEFIGSEYSKSNKISFKLTELKAAYPLLTEARVEAHCDDLVNANKLFLSSGKSRTKIYDIEATAISLLPRPKEAHLKIIPDNNNSVQKVKPVLQPKQSATVRLSTNIEKSTEKKQKITNINQKSERTITHYFKTPASKIVNSESSPSSISFVNQVTITPPETTLETVIHLVMSSVDSDVVYVSNILPKCVEKGISEETLRECLRALMDKNKIFFNDNEIYIM